MFSNGSNSIVHKMLKGGVGPLFIGCGISAPSLRAGWLLIVAKVKGDIA